MTLGELLEAMAARGSVLVIDGGRFLHRGPRLEAGDPIRQALATFRDEVFWLLTSGRLCVMCPRMLAENDKTLCAPHRAESDALHTENSGRTEGTVAA